MSTPADREVTNGAASLGDGQTGRLPGPRSTAPPARRRKKKLPRLMLAPLEPAELIYERLQEPTDESPILYRERAYLVDTLQTDDDLEEHLEAELSRIRRDWRHRDASQFVQLSLFDHRFAGEPSFPPIATLSWKDWQGRSEIWVRGVRRSTLPPGVPVTIAPLIPRAPGSPELPLERGSIEPPRMPLDVLDLDAEVVELDADVIDDEDDEGSGEPSAEAIPLVARFEAELRSSPESARHSVSPAGPSSSEVEARGGAEAGLDAPASAAPDDTSDDAPDSGPGWQSPDKSGEYLIPLPDELLSPPSSQRVLASEELIGALFERMHELAYAASVAAGADFVLALLLEHIPCDGVLMHVFDAPADEFVVLRASGPRSKEVLGRRMPAARSHLREVLRGRAALELGPSDVARSLGQWPALGVSPRNVVASPVQRDERSLGAIELCRTADQGEFNPGQVSALEYVCEQFADFVADRPVELARASLFPPRP